ncbi:MAG: OmpH family outer membrane protein [Gammaproteobacteria bacterium]|nr:OmpH family outer membrane protein [Gammaproteobacteria bacterium]
MKKWIWLFPLLVLLNGVAVAAEKSAVGFVDVRKVLLESKIGKKNKAEFEKMIKEKESTLNKEEEKLKAMQEAFQKDQLLMTDDQKKAKQKAFQEKADAYQNMVKDAKQEIGKKDNEYAAKSMADIRGIIADLAREMKLNLVLEASESGLLYAEEGMDLTPKVIEKYNAKSK